MPREGSVPSVPQETVGRVLRRFNESRWDLDRMVDDTVEGTDATDREKRDLSR
jgi:hypothetical protein